MPAAFLNESDKDKVRAWMIAKAPKLTCPGCEKRTWAIHDHLYEGRLLSVGPFEIGNETLNPTVVLVCNNCALITQMAALPMQLDCMKQ